MEVKSIRRYVRVSPQKARRVAELVKGKHVDEALDILLTIPSKPAKYIHKILKCAVGNAENDYEIDRKSLYVKNVIVDQGPMLKRWMPRARGRADMIRKRTSHITVIIQSVGEE
ncbi:MAG: 50S ribosomal protein L22 [Armatimonadota bacterium]|nr:50S ribosomal protein L22 [Armatimonadota bacterium]MCX7776928.1 50S ribosomal protein L22 [Armatimonadota bacterium]MDW8024761.1 50S ribosomal protein L22 [Armatimonadota bacterium]